MKQLIKMITLFILFALVTAVANARQGRGHKKCRQKNRVVYQNRNMYHSNAVRILPNGKVKPIPPGWNKGKKSGWLNESERH